MRTRSPYCRNIIGSERCGKIQSEHVDGKCPRDPNRNFAVLAASPKRASGSFAEDELSWISTMITTGLRGGDVRVLMRRPECVTVLRHVTNMLAVIDRQKKAHDAQRKEPGK